jgi:hypothetical protein
MRECPHRRWKGKAGVQSSLWHNAESLQEDEDMQIWVDADACPGAIKDILYRAAQRVRVPLVLVANQPLHPPKSPYIRTVQVPRGFDMADKHIAQSLEAGDLVITADIPLAAEAVQRGADAINPRGERYTDDNIRQRLAMRDLMDQLRSSGEITGGPPPLGQGDRQAFANALDRLLARQPR